MSGCRVLMHALLLALLWLLANTCGCWGGVNTVRIATLPSKADLYVNGEFVGQTPKSVPEKWSANILGVTWGDALQIVITKTGYEQFEQTIPFSELAHRYWSGDCIQWESEFGWGSTFPYTITLREAPASSLKERVTAKDDPPRAVSGIPDCDVEATAPRPPVVTRPTTPPPTRPPTRPSRPIANRWAVVVGISEYEHADGEMLTELTFADKDARDFADTLKLAGWRDYQIRELANESATKQNIEVALESWLTKARSNDVVVLFWSGHGFPDPDDPEKVYFACYDTDPSIPPTGYRMDRVIDSLRERDVRNVVVLADTCHAGKLITRGNRSVGVEAYVRDTTVPPGWIYMVAADSDRQAIEHSSWSNGAFTHCLLRGLLGEADGYQSASPRDDRVTMGELRTYLALEMPERTQRTLGIAKHPVITTSSGDREIWELSISGD